MFYKDFPTFPVNFRDMSGNFPEIPGKIPISGKSAEAPSEANASGRVDPSQSNKSQSILIQIPRGRDLCLPLTPSTAPARFTDRALPRANPS